MPGTALRARPVELVKPVHAAEVLSYNALVQSWPEIVRLAREEALQDSPTIPGLF